MEVKKYVATDEMVAAVLGHLHKGKDNAVKHDVLISLTGLKDRQLRLALEKARRDFCIINDQDGKGYYLPENKEDAKRYYKQEYNRAMSILVRLDGTKNYIRQMEGQVEIEEV